MYRSLLENLKQALFLKNRDGVFIYVNEPFCRFVGRTSDEIIGQTDLDLFPKELAEKSRADDLRVIEEDRKVQIIEENPGEDGETPLKQEGEIVGMQGVFWDVTERKVMKDALVKNEEQFRAFMAYSPAVAWVKDQELKDRHRLHSSRRNPHLSADRRSRWCH